MNTGGHIFNFCYNFALEIQDKAAGAEKQSWRAAVQDQGNAGEIREERQSGEPALAMEFARVGERRGGGAEVPNGEL